jgi:hypothetical protein
MAEGYCFKCKTKREIANPVEELMKCPTCGAVMFKILGGKATPPPAAPAPSPAPPTDATQPAA